MRLFLFSLFLFQKTLIANSFLHLKVENRHRRVHSIFYSAEVGQFFSEAEVKSALINQHTSKSLLKIWLIFDNDGAELCAFRNGFCDEGDLSP